MVNFKVYLLSYCILYRRLNLRIFLECNIRGNKDESREIEVKEKEIRFRSCSF